MTLDAALGAAKPTSFWLDESIAPTAEPGHEAWWCVTLSVTPM
jgi:hypothetical protein